MLVKMVTTTGEEHGLVNTIGNSVPPSDYKHMDPKNKAELERQRKEDSRKVKVKYINTKGRNERLYKPYCKYAGDVIDIYNLIPGYTYTLPYGMVREVNDIKKIKRSGLVSEDGQNLTKDGSPIQQDIEGESEHMLVPAEF